MRDSIIINMEYADYDLIDGRPNVERHHCLQGPDRAKAEEYGLWVPLTPEHHREGKISAHNSIEMQRLLQIIAQLSFEEEMLSTKQADNKEEAREMFRRTFYKSYL